VLTLRQKMPIVRPPFGKSFDFLESIPSKSEIFLEVDPQLISRPRSSCQKIGNRCRSHRHETPTPSKRIVPMKRLSLLAVALLLLTTASGCCCGMFRGCGGGCGYPPPCGSCGYAPQPCGSCGYQPAYGAPAPCSTCPTCPGGGCGVQGGPVMQQGAFYEGSFGTAISSTSPTLATPTLAAANELRTY
jgi:hypothetical protein